MSEAFTWTQIKTKLESDLIIQDEDWIDETELLGYTNEAIRDCEAIIHGLYEDYFLDYATVTFVAGTEEYALPTGIYGDKIRRFLFENGSIRYVIPRMKDWKKFEKKSYNDFISPVNAYQYFVISPTAGAQDKIVMSPNIKSADAGAFGKIWFIREAQAMTNSASVCDIPEFINYIYAHVKSNVYAKEGHPNLSLALGNLQREETLMEGTLSTMVPDADNEIEPDFEWYEEMN